MENNLKKILLTLLVLLSSAFATVTNEYTSQKLLDANIPVVDIRTPGEWRETGLLKGAIPIMFFDGRGNYDLDAFLKALRAKVDTTMPFALICHSGNRTTTLSAYLSKEYGYKIINLKGGMNYVKGARLPITPYK